MKEKILALLKAQFQGVRKDGLNHIANILSFQVNTEDEANTLVGNLTAEQVNSFITDWRKEVDAEIGKANKTYEDGLKKKYDFTEKKTEPANPTLPEPDKAGNFDAAAFQKMFNESMEKIVKPLQETIASLKGEKTKETRLQALNDKLKECNDANFKAKALKDFARMTFDTDEAFDEYLADTEADVKTTNQNVADSGLGAQGRPWTSNTPPDGKEATDAEISAVMNKLPS
jgi:alpha-galactosidase/6-phospho-beta-glucosidase family protein